jgi:hypothetical protein
VPRTAATEVAGRTPPGVGGTSARTHPCAALATRGRPCGGYLTIRATAGVTLRADVAHAIACALVPVWTAVLTIRHLHAAELRHQRDRLSAVPTCGSFRDLLDRTIQDHDHTGCTGMFTLDGA